MKPFEDWTDDEISADLPGYRWASASTLRLGDLITEQEFREAYVAAKDLEANCSVVDAVGGGEVFDAECVTFARGTSIEAADMIAVAVNALLRAVHR